MAEDVDARKQVEPLLVRAINGRTDRVGEAGRITTPRVSRGVGARRKPAERSAAPKTTMARRSPPA